MAEDTLTTKIKAARQRKPAGGIVSGAAPTVPAVDTVQTLPEIAAEAAAAPVQVIEPVEAVTSPAQVQDPISGPAATSAPTSEGLSHMATIAPPSATETVDKAQAVFGDASARFKTAFEKSSKLGEDMVEFAKGNVEALVASSRVAAKGAESLGQEAAEYSKKSFESATAAFKNFATVKSPTELFTLQSEFAKASFDSAVAEASKLSETFLKLAGDIAQPISTRYALAAEKFKSTAL